MKIKLKHLLIAIIILFGILAVVSSVPACVPITPSEIELDEGNKIIKIGNNKYYVSWYAYRYSKNKDDKIMFHKDYKLKNKGGKIVSEAYTYYEIEKPQKNRIRVTTTYSTEPRIESVKTYKTKLNVKDFYLTQIKTQFAKKIDKKAFYKRIAIDEGQLEAVLPNNDPNSGNVSSIRHYVNWTAKSFTKFPDTLHIDQIYGNDAPVIRLLLVKGIGMIGNGASSKYYPPSITLKKTSKNTIKITIGNMYKVNGDITNHRTYTVKTKLSVKNYYQKVFRHEMVKMFSLN
jgi:hypothetical protein